MSNSFVAAPPAKLASFAAVAYVLGFLAIVLAGAMLLPAFVATGQDMRDLGASFALVALATAFIGGGLMFAMQGVERRMRMREALALVIIAWAVLPLLGALPLVAGRVSGDFTDAYFEAMSALTSTGISVLPDADAFPPAVQLWRAILAWIGGFGTVLMASALLAALGTLGDEIHAPGIPFGLGNAATERFARGAGRIFSVYALVTVAGVILLWLGDTPGIQALCLALSSVATAGLFPEDVAYVGGFGRAVLCVLMLFGALNFIAHSAAFRGRLAAYVQDRQLGLLAIVTASAFLLFALAVALRSGFSVFRSDWDELLFNAISTTTTTGIYLGGAAPHPPAMLLIAIGFSLVGGASLSTAGGIKLIRMALVFEQGRSELRRLGHPRGIVRVRHKGRALDPAVMLGVWALIGAYLAILAVTSIVLAGTGLDLMTAFATAAGALANAGTLLDLTAAAPSNIDLTDGAKWLLCFTMAAGRLEALALLSVFSPIYWRA